MTAMPAPRRDVVTRPASAARLVNFRAALRSGTSLPGYAAVDFGGWVVNEIPIFRGADGRLSPGVPTAPDIGPDGRQRERDGKRQYRKILTFPAQNRFLRYQETVLLALAHAGIGTAR